MQVSGRKSPDSSFRSEKVLKKGYDKVGRVNQTFYALTLTHTQCFNALMNSIWSYAQWNDSDVQRDSSLVTLKRNLSCI